MSKEQQKPTGTGEPFITEDGFTPDNSGLPRFIDFKEKGDSFTGEYLGKFEWNPDKAKTPEWTALKFRDDMGIEVLISSSYQIERAITKYGFKTYRFIFEGYKELDKGKTVKEFKVLVK